MRRAHGLAIVKLGGSFAFSPHLTRWIEAVAACAGRVVVVPGGGPFADAVHSVQGTMGFDDRAAHRMALLAMEQYGLALASRNALLSPADSADAIARGLAAGQVPLWMPARMVRKAADIAESWDATSDSLAAWLAARIGARRLFLVKHIELPGGRACADQLMANGILDREFARHLRTNAIAAFILGPSDYAAAVAAICDGAAAGIPVE